MCHIRMYISYVTWYTSHKAGLICLLICVAYSSYFNCFAPSVGENSVDLLRKQYNITWNQ